MATSPTHASWQIPPSPQVGFQTLQEGMSKSVKESRDGFSPNGVFHTVWSRVVCSEGGQDPRGQKAPKCLKTVVFSAMFVSVKGIASVASRGQESEKHSLENTVCSPLVAVVLFCQIQAEASQVRGLDQQAPIRPRSPISGRLLLFPCGCEKQAD